MKTITKQINLYKFEELEQSVKDRIILEYRYNDQFFWGDELIESLNKWASYTGVGISNYSLDEYNSTVNWSYDGYCYNHEFDYLIDLQGIRLSTWLSNNWLELFCNPKIIWLKNHLPSQSRKSRIQKSYDCPLTGCTSDYELVQPILDQIAKPNPDYCLEDVIDDCINGFTKQYENEMQYWNSEECITEEIGCNDYTFLSNGEVYNEK